MFGILKTRIKTFRVKVNRAIRNENGKIVYEYTNPLESDKMINDWIRKNKAIIKNIDIQQVVMSDKKEYNTIDFIYTIQYIKG